MDLHVDNWYAGWALILTGFVTGAGLGLFFHNEQFLGGYTSFRRRIVRLGHIAFVALGMLNVLFSLSSRPQSDPWAHLASSCLVVGGITMPLVCFLTGWKPGLRRLFVVPVAFLVLAVVLILSGGPP
jgi:hypothetical protein